MMMHRLWERYAISTVYLLGATLVLVIVAVQRGLS